MVTSEYFDRLRGKYVLTADVKKSVASVVPNTLVEPGSLAGYVPQAVLI